MPDENINCTDVLNALDTLEDYCLENLLAKTQNYGVIKSALERDVQIDVKVLERILAVCVHDLKEDPKNVGIIMNVLPLIIYRVKDVAFDESLDLLPSVLALINIINTWLLMYKADTVKGLCFDTLMSYPDATLIAAADQNHLEVLELFTMYCHTKIPNNTRQQACRFLYKLLKILPPEKKRSFIGRGTSVWFSKIIPTAMSHIMLNELDHGMCVDILELLTEDLVYFEYTEDKYWQTILESISQPHRYPAIMKNLLQKGNPSWNRLWIVFIKLLKHQITQSINGIGTPINSMLPVVEAAFKVDVVHRCKAFECWNVLIDSFATETNESNISKRIKLLVIPLKSNNAKVEETALAKFKCWWHLILKFQTKMDKFLDMIIVSFLNFIFGRHNAVDKNTIIPGQININVTKQTVKAIVDLVGHVDCDGCTALPRLNGKVINPKHLVDNWSHWVYSLTSAIMIAANEDEILTHQQVKCLWKSFILTIGELPDNYIRKDLFYEMLSIVKHLIQKSEHKSKLADIAFNILLMSLFDGDESIKTLLKTKNGDNNPMNETLNILQEACLKDFYKSHDTRELVTKLKCITNLIVDKHFNPTYVVARFLAELPGTDIALILWTAVAESVLENERMCVKNLNSMLLWPLKYLDQFSDVKLAAMTWYTLYNLVQPKINKTDIDKEIMKSLLAPKEYTTPVSYFTLCALLAVFKNKFADEQFTGYNREAELLEILIKTIDNYKNIEQLFPILIDTLVLFLHNVTVNINENLATHALSCFKSVLKITSEELIYQCNEDHTFILFGNVLSSIDKLISKEPYSKLIPFVIDDLINHTHILCKQSSIKSILLNLMKNIMHKIKDNDEILCDKIKAAIYYDEDVRKTPTNIEAIDANEIKGDDKSDKSKFTTPITKEVPKKSKKKEPSIVSTVLENGEEYVVVKSNWKFNPRKLTENQKEKFKRKREDIPALYQDLSQSQDDFQLAPWKTDSQDTSSSKSESKSNVPTNEDTVTNLKNLPSSNVVPNILENLTKEKRDNTNSANDVLPITVSNKIEPSTPKNTKSPRMALKDRVFRNVRNLIESSLQKENNETVEHTKPEGNKTPTVTEIDSKNNKTEIIIATPKTNKVTVTDNVLNSAPPLLSADRPSRVKRKPKKFDDLELLALKKRRHSLQSTHSGGKSNMVKKDLNTDANSTDKESITTNHFVDINDPNQKQDVIEVPDSDTADKNANQIQNIPVNHMEVNTDSKEEVKDEKVSDNKLLEIEDIKLDSNADIETEKLKETTIDTTVKEIQENTKPDTNADNEVEKVEETLVDTTVKDTRDISTPKQTKKTNESKSTTKKSSAKKSRIEKELAIDMVEGHPFLKMQSEKRLTRKNAATPPLINCRRKGLADKMNKSKSDSTPAKSEKKNKSENVDISIVVHETQENAKDSSPEDVHCSEDVIESSQESTFSTLSVKSAKKTVKKVPLVSLEKLQQEVTNKENIDVSQSILDCGVPTKVNHDSRDYIELSVNKTVEEVQNSIDLTENMDTEPVNEDISDDVIIINDDVPVPMTVSSDDTTIGPETQEIAEADTQPTDPKDFMDTEVSSDLSSENAVLPDVIENQPCIVITVETEVGDKVTEKSVNIQDEKTVTLSESACAEIIEAAEVSSPFKDDVQRKQDFLNNTIEISPIKTMSPDLDKKSPSPDKSSDYVVIKLTSPVSSNGEPFEKCDSPEFFTDDKVSPDKRDQSPPRVEASVINTSPSSSLSLKKNRPQVRSGGRAAQMLGLCVPDKLHTIINQDRTEPEEAKKCSPSNTSARRNLRILYNTVQSEDNNNSNENDDVESFLKFKRTLPTVDSSPSGPILKRKIGEITDDTTVSPASKRKRVSFHDPPVSTTISVQKYIEPGGVRSPQNSAQKRLERQMRQYTPVKSPKRLENVFKLDSALTKTLESFAEVEALNPTDDTQASSLDETPLVEIVKASELNDTDPICPDLLECKDPIDNIASELSSPAMKTLLIKELEGKVETVGDLAKMTELEVNRLCIKAPKVKVAKKVLSDYAAKKAAEAPEVTVTINEAMFDETMNEPVPKGADVEIQTDNHVISHMEVQTISVPVIIGSSQTEVVSTSHISIQTDESGEQTTEDLVKSHLLKRSDFVEVLSEHLEEPSIQRLSEKLPFNALTDVFMKKFTPSDSNAVLDRLLEQRNADTTSENRRNTQLTFLQDYICDRFDSKDLILFCSQLLQRVHDKPA